MTRDDVSQIAFMAAAALPNQVKLDDAEAADDLVSAWLLVLADLPYAAVEGAVAWHLAESKWFPTPAELRERAIRLLDGIVPYESYAGLGGAGMQQRVRRSVAAGRSMELPA